MFTDADRDMLRETYNAVFHGGPSMPDGHRSLAESVAGIRADVADARRGLGGLLHRLTTDVADDGDTASIPRLSRRLGVLLRDLAQPRK